MGRFMEIARSLPPVKTEIQTIRLDQEAHRGAKMRRDATDEAACAKSAVSPAKAAPVFGEEFHPASSTVLRVLVEAGRPVLHSQIVKTLMQRGHGKERAKEGIAHCQGKGWIIHNLVTGYILTK